MPVPQRLRLVQEPVATSSPGKFPLSAELLLQHVLPFLSYPSVGRLANTCSWMRASIGPHGLADAMDRYKSRTHGRFQVQQRTVSLRTTNEEPFSLTCDDVPRMAFAGRNLVGATEHESVIDRRWPERALPQPVAFTFRTLFRRMLEHPELKVWARITPTHVLHLYAHGDPPAIRSADKDAVFKVMVEFQQAE